MRPARNSANDVSSNLFAFSTGRRIGLSLHKREVAGSSPVSGHQCRSSSGVERVTSQFVFYPSVYFSGPKIMGYRTLQVGGSYPSSRFDASSSIGRATVLSRSLLARRLVIPGVPLLMGRSCGLSHVIGSTPVAGSICRPSSMVEQPPRRMRG